MSLRLARVNELIKREIGNFLRRRYRSESVCWTITGVDVSADLRSGMVAYSVIGGDIKAREAQQFFRKHAGEIRREVSKHVILKYSPKLNFTQDFGIERGNRVMEILDDLENTESEPPSENV